MLKYVNTMVTFSEVPDEISLCIEISNCPCRCKNCHSSYLAEDIGEELTFKALDTLIKNNNGITCVAFMGGDAEPIGINILASYVKEYYPNIKTAWYSGRQELSDAICLKHWDYIKLGPYIEELGPLNSKTTNQKFYEVIQAVDTRGSITYGLNDVTYKFHRDAQ